MKISPSYDKLTGLIGVCGLVSVLAVRDIYRSDDTSMVWLASGVLVAVVALAALLLYLQRKMKRRAENKVRMSDLILLTDIQTPAKSNSQLLDDAIALYSAQIEQGRNPGDYACWSRRDRTVPPSVFNIGRSSATVGASFIPWNDHLVIVHRCPPNYRAIEATRLAPHPTRDGPPVVSRPIRRRS